MACNSMSDKISAYVALISNISEKDRARDVEQFDDILRTFTNEMNKFESRFGKTRDDQKMLSVKKLMTESLLNYRFRGTTMSYSKLTIALYNTVVDKVSTVLSSKSSRNDTGAPMEIGMAAKENGENVSQEGDQRVVTSLCRLSTEANNTIVRGSWKATFSTNRIFFASDSRSLGISYYIFSLPPLFVECSG